jgi:hypothetical protein
MQFSGNKNIVNQNREIAKNYGEIKEAYLAHIVKREISFFIGYLENG